MCEGVGEWNRLSPGDIPVGVGGGGMIGTGTGLGVPFTGSGADGIGLPFNVSGADGAGALPAKGGGEGEGLRCGGGDLPYNDGGAVSTTPGGCVMPGGGEKLCGEEGWEVVLRPLDFFLGLLDNLNPNLFKNFSTFLIGSTGFTLVISS